MELAFRQGMLDFRAVMADRRTPSRMRLLMGFGLDSDGHARVTRSEEYVLLGGSEATHQRMHDQVERFCDELRRMGTDLQRASDDDMLNAAGESGLL